MAPNLNLRFQDSSSLSLEDHRHDDYVDVDDDSLHHDCHRLISDHRITSHDFLLQQEENTRRRDWWNRCIITHGRRPCPSNQASPDLMQALQSIHLLQDLKGKEADWITTKYQGELHEIPNDFIESIAAKAPTTLAAKVADWNENLSYQFEPQAAQDYGFDRLKPLLRHQDLLGSFLTTETTIPQPAHVDYTWQVLEDAPPDALWLGFFPLTQEGMFLQVWPSNHVIQDSHKKKKNYDPSQIVTADLIFVPYGRLLLLPACTIHGGGFRTTPLVKRSTSYNHDNDDNDDEDVPEGGNLRFHLYLARNSKKKDNNTATPNNQQLPAHQTNKYTEPHDPRRELWERHVDAPYMNILQEYLFV